MKKSILNLNNNEVGTIDLDENVFGQKILPDILHQYIRYQNAKSRQGSHKVKSRSEVNGRSKKPFSQKGTGNARQGSNKPPNFRGGAVSMGPQNRDYSFNLNNFCCYRIKNKNDVDDAFLFIFWSTIRIYVEISN